MSEGKEAHKVYQDVAQLYLDHQDLREIKENLESLLLDLEAPLDLLVEGVIREIEARLERMENQSSGLLAATESSGQEALKVNEALEDSKEKKEKKAKKASLALRVYKGLRDYRPRTPTLKRL